MLRHISRGGVLQIENPRKAVWVMAVPFCIEPSVGRERAVEQAGAWSMEHSGSACCALSFAHAVATGRHERHSCTDPRW